MEITSSSAHNRELADWYNKIKNGNIKLPRFQRMEAWDRWRIQSFWDTVIHNLPIGVTLILSVGNEEKFKSRFISTATPSTFDKVTEHLLDGQQRLTSFWRTLHNNYESETYFVYFPEYDEYKETNSDDENISVIYKTRFIRNNQRYPLWVDMPTECIRRGLMPIQLFRPENIQSEIDEWIDAATKYKEPSEDDENAFIKLKEYTKFQKEVSDKITKLRETISHFNLPFLSLPSSTSKEIALQVFINMNTNSKQLSLYDIIVAEVEEEIGQSLHELQNKLDEKHPRIKEYFELEFLILATSSLLQDKLPNQRGMVELNKSIFIDEWDKLENCLYRMSIFLASQGIYDKNRLPTNAVLSVIAALYAYIPENGDLAGRGEILLKKYLWSSFFTNRYENSTASRAYQDFTNLKRVLLQETNEDVPYTEQDVPVLNRKNYPLIEKEELIETGWPKKVNIKGRGVLAIANYLGANDFADGRQISPENINNREYHHIFPDSLLNEAKIEYQSFYALNCALITGKTNRNIGRKDPLKYLTERYQWADEEIINNRLNSHLIPINELANGGYENVDGEERIQKIKNDYYIFLDARADLVLKAIEILTQGKELTKEAVFRKEFEMPKPLENILVDIEKIEIKLRELVCDTLEPTSRNPFEEYASDFTKTSVNGKISSHLKKFPGDTMEMFSSFKTKLNYFTLGDLKEVVIKRNCWDYFEPTFKIRQNVDVRFNQLMTLRNQLAHNNELNDIMLKDGEAAIIWFKSILNI